jgi:multicomponent Na+:H+ antiporter subunit G
VNAVLDVLTAVLLLTGSLLTVIAAIGLFRLPDAYGRIHVATKPATLGVVCSVTGAALQVPFGSGITKMALAVIVQFWTIPASSHLIGRAARATGLEPARPNAVDEFDEAG